MSTDLEAAGWSTKLLQMQIERTVAMNELREYGIEPSPADVEAWLASPPRSRRRLMEHWLAFNASYSK